MGAGKKVLAAGVVLGALLAGVEVIGGRYAEEVLGARVQRELGLVERPQVKLRPLLLGQVVRGRYHDVELSAARVQSTRLSSVELANLQVRVGEITLPPGERFRPTRLDITEARVRAVIPLASLNEQLPEGVRLEVGEGGPELVYQTTVQGSAITLAATPQITVTGTQLAITGTEVRAEGVRGELPLPDLPPGRVSLPDLAGVEIRSARLTRAGVALEVEAEMANLVLG